MISILIKGSQRLVSALEWARLKVSPLTDKVFEKIFGNDKYVEQVDMLADAEFAREQQNPLRARFLVRAGMLVVGILLIWSALFSLDEIAKGDGKLIPSRQLQVLQSMDGGIVSEILVHEGQQVEAGDLLLEVDPTRFVSDVKERRSQYLATLVKAARLTALAEGRSFIAPPEAVAEDPATVEQERRLYESRRSELDAQISVVRQQLMQRRQELSETMLKRDGAIQGYDLVSKEWAVTKPLLQTGAVSEVEVLRLEREVSRLKGERDQAGVQISRVQAAISEVENKLHEIDISFRNEARKELAETVARVNSLLESSVALNDKVRHTSIRSSVKGTVKRLLVTTVGGVVQPGRDLVEIVPSEDALLVEAKMSPKDIAFLRPGQRAIVKFTAYDFAVYGGLEGTLEQIGADTVTDEKGNTYYVVRVRTNRPKFGDDMPIIPGMVVEVNIVTGKKSLLSYLLKPVVRAKQSAFIER